MYTTIVTIGRNVNDEQNACLTAGEWQDFRGYVLDLMMAMGYRIGDGQHTGGDDSWYLSDSHGQGFWEGQPEENYSVTLLHGSEMTPTNYEEMRNELKRYARTFRQDAIALIGQVTADLVPPAQ